MFAEDEVRMDFSMFIDIFSGGSRGGGAPGARPAKGPNSFISTYKFYETWPCRELATPAYEVEILDPPLNSHD